MNKFTLVIHGVRDTLPLVLAAVPFGILFGALCQAFELPLVLCMAMSVFVFAGSSQFVAANLLGIGTPWMIVVGATFIVNLRHMMYSANLMKHVRPYSQLRRAMMAFGLTDETFATVLNRLNKHQDEPFSGSYYFGSYGFMYSNWIFCSWLGFVLGGQLEDPLAWGLDVAMVVAFIGIVTPLLVNHLMWLSAILAGTTAVLCHDLPFQLGIVASALVAIVIPTVLSIRQKATSSSTSAAANIQRPAQTNVQESNL
ncbi:AzlC family ABC transporter permease [Litoribrevibacter euphylliae]|uniref:AzlC family ABC transporter permease n=1 Tax=Litoribrevibacter euphylliae TaxID=1834034 RepID=A0ABV7HJJ9_9GAMM